MRSPILEWTRRPSQLVSLGEIGHLRTSEALLWTMGESLLGPSQIQHALQVCKDAFPKQAAARSDLRIFQCAGAPMITHVTYADKPSKS